MAMSLNRLDPKVPDPVESRRRAAGRFVRFLYGASVFALIVFFVAYFGAGLVFLSGPGVVTAPLHVISLPYVVQVISVDVTPGAEVAAGAEIARVRSPEYNNIISNYMRALVDLVGREAELKIKARVAEDSLEAARAHLRITEDAVKRLEASRAAAGSVALSYSIEVYGARAQANRLVVSLEAEAAECTTQLAVLGELRERLDWRIAQTDKDFAGGRVDTPLAGIVSTRLADAGQSLVAGAPIAEIFDTRDIYVHWYIPNARLVDPAVGGQVVVLYGNRRIHGTIEAILPVSSVFNGSQILAAAGRQSAQVARIRLDTDVPRPPLNATVEVHMYYANIVGRGALALVHFLGLH